MKAAVIYENGSPDVLRYEDVPDPECPDGRVLIDVEAISIEAKDLWAKNNALRGVFLGGALLDEYPRVHATITELIGRVGTGELRVVIDRTFPLAAAAAAHAYIESRQAFGRVVMNP
jgi:NADPH:quinone reductase-like Zn-dependent oxidoreductase